MNFKTILHRAVRFFYPHGSIRRVLRGPLSGMRFVVSPGMGATYAWGIDSMNLGFLHKRVQAGWHILDVGANRGQMALFFARAAGPQGRVLSLEPVPDNFHRLEQNLGMNPCKQVKALCLAAGRAKTTLQFDYDPERHTEGTFADLSPKSDGHRPSIAVPCEPLDEIAEREGFHPQLIKIDVEGSGGEVLAGAVGLLKGCHPTVYLEVHALYDQSPELVALRELKDRWGYSIIDMDGAEVEEFTAVWGRSYWCAPPR